MNKLLALTVVALGLSLGVLWQVGTVSDAQGAKPAAAATAASESAESTLIKESRATLLKLHSTQLKMQVENGATPGEIIEKVCLAAGVTVGSTLELHKEAANEPFEAIGELNGRASDLLDYFAANFGLNWTVLGATIWFAEGGVRDFTLTRAYETADIQEFLNRRHAMLKKLESKAPAVAKGEDGKKDIAAEVIEEGFRAESYLTETISDLLADSDLDTNSVLSYGGVISVKANPNQHVKIEDFLSELRKTLSLR